MRVPPTPLNDGDDVHSAQVTGAGTKGTRSAVTVVHQHAKGVLLRRPHPSVADTRSIRSAAADYTSNSSIPRRNEIMCAKRRWRMLGVVRSSTRTSPRMHENGSEQMRMALSRSFISLFSRLSVISNTYATQLITRSSEHYCNIPHLAALLFSSCRLILGNISSICSSDCSMFRADI